METGFESDQHSGPDNSLLSAQSEYYNLHCCRWPMCLIALFISLSVCLTVCLSAHQIAVREGAGVKHSSIESTRKCQPKNDLDMENVLASPSLCLCVSVCVCKRLCVSRHLMVLQPFSFLCSFLPNSLHLTRRESLPLVTRMNDGKSKACFRPNACESIPTCILKMCAYVCKKKGKTVGTIRICVKPGCTGAANVVF